MYTLLLYSTNAGSLKEIKIASQCFIIPAGTSSYATRKSLDQLNSYCTHRNLATVPVRLGPRGSRSDCTNESAAITERRATPPASEVWRGPRLSESQGNRNSFVPTFRDIIRSETQLRRPSEALGTLCSRRENIRQKVTQSVI